MISNIRARTLLERDFSIWTHQSWISWRYPIPRNWLVWEWLLNWDALDSSWYWNNWTATNVTYADTDVGYQKQMGVFNGSNSNIVIADNASLKPTWNFTIVAVIKTTSNTNQWIFQSWSQNANNAWIRFWLFTTDWIRFETWRNTWWTEDTDWKKVIYSSASVRDWNNHIIVWRYNWADLSIFIDWVLVNSVAWTYWPWYSATNYVRIWCLNNSWTNLFFWVNWNEQKVRLYNRDLSNKEIIILTKELQKLLH